MSWLILIYTTDKDFMINDVRTKIVSNEHIISIDEKKMRKKRGSASSAYARPISRNWKT